MKRILYCNCAYARIIPEDVKKDVLRRLAGAGVAFEAVADLCELSARKDPSLKRLAAPVEGGEESSELKIVACYPRAVKWLFSAAAAALPESGVDVLNMREDAADRIVASLLGEVAPAGESMGNPDTGQKKEESA